MSVGRKKFWDNFVPCFGLFKEPRECFCLHSAKNMKIQPNILITGTPGVGKSHLAKQVSEKLGLKWHNVSQIAKEHEFLEGFDKVLDCPILDEDAVSSWELCK